ncbi:hypothetical protein OB905_13575 [Halobacteria archaeon AArc-dxtr1]|nr:hypothetical protein [Halobacteria archaeon AArc-dxtr1]
MSRTHVPFSDLRSAAYCPRACYYDRQQNDREPPPRVGRVRDLAFRYPDLLDSSETSLATEPIEVGPQTYRARLESLRSDLESQNRWAEIRAPSTRNVLATGRHARGIIHKVLEEPLEPVVVSPGAPPESGVWDAQSVHAVATAKALAWERQETVTAAWVEYPAHAVIRRVRMTTRRRARYRSVLRTVRQMDGPPPRDATREKCEACTHSDQCGVRTRTLRSLLGGR